MWGSLLPSNYLMSKKNVILDKSYSFAVRVIGCYKFLTIEKKEYVLAKQLLRCGTSIGANIREADSAFSKKDFIYKVQTSLKEAQETCYWLSLLKDTDYLEAKVADSLIQDCDEIIWIIIRILKTSKANLNSKEQ